MKRLLPFLLILLVAGAAIGGGFYFYRVKVAQLVPVAQKDGVARTEAQTAHARGPANAPLTLEEFGDFQCPPCGILHSVLIRLEHDYGDKLRVIFHQFPLEMHNHALEAASAAEAAGLQGKFWEMHDLLYRNQMLWSKEIDARPLFNGYARSLDLDMDKFVADAASKEVAERIAADKKLGASLGVTSTPSIFINNQPLAPTSFNEPALRAALDATLRGEKPPAPTPRPPVTPILTPTPTPVP